MSFSGYEDDCNPLYTRLNILKLEDHSKLLNCLLLHADSLNKQTPTRLQTYFKQASESHLINTRGSQLGCLYVPQHTTTKYGLNCITKKCITDWNNITKQLGINLLHLTRQKLKHTIKDSFIKSYS